MALHYAEQIIAQLLITLQAIPSSTVAAVNIERDRVDPFENLPAISLEEGADDILLGSDKNESVMDSLLEVEVVVHAKKSTGVSAQLNQIRKEIFIALMADLQQGLPSIVIDTDYIGAEKPQRSDAAENAVMQQSINFEIKYRHSNTDPSI